MNDSKAPRPIRIVERRASSRFPLDQDVRFKVFLDSGEKVTGAGKTLDMSSAGVLFTTDTPLQAGRRIELSIQWPAQINATCRLKLVATGRIVRVVGQTAAIVIEKHEFRTLGMHGLSGPPGIG